MNPVDPSNTTTIYNLLKGANPNMDVYLKQEVPEELHFTNNRRICPIILIANLGWTITTTSQYNANPSRLNGGNHGYLPSFPEMYATFIACGPDFKTGVNYTHFENVQVYNLLAHLLNIKPNPNNGSFDVMEDMLNYR